MCVMCVKECVTMSVCVLMCFIYMRSGYQASLVLINALLGSLSNLVVTDSFFQWLHKEGH